MVVGLLCTGCSPKLAGVETTNGCTVVATATSVEGTAPPLSRVFLFGERYIPFIDSGLGIGTAADADGACRFSAPPGAYNVFIIGPTGEAAGFAVATPAAGANQVLRNGMLQRVGAVSGAVSAADSDTLLVFLSGMCHYQLLCAGRSFSLKSVPAGTYELVIARLTGSAAGVTWKTVRELAVTVSPDETAAVGEVSF
jgi:hypothetical protein